MSGYSKKSLVEKLGIRPGMRMIILNQSEQYADALGELPKDAIVSKRLSGMFDFIQFFTLKREILRAEFPFLQKHLKQNGSLWISWLKASSKIQSDVNENIIRDIGLENGLVDVKVCAIDENWSGLKFVFRLKDRTKV